jgi:hypothetical protein
MITFLTKEIDERWRFFVYKDHSIILGASHLDYKTEIQCSVAARNHIFQKYNIRWATKEKDHEFLGL